MLTEKHTLPPMEELEVQEIDLTRAALLASANHVGSQCLQEMDEFMLCRKEERDPRKCIDYGKSVTSCSIKILKQIKGACLNEFEQYAYCIDTQSNNFELARCRKTQYVFDKCMLDNLGMERPHFARFTEARTVETKRPRPENHLPPPEFKNLPKPIDFEEIKKRVEPKQYLFNLLNKSECENF